MVTDVATLERRISRIERRLETLETALEKLIPEDDEELPTIEEDDVKIDYKPGDFERIARERGLI